jgi:uncharacterized protein
VNASARDVIASLRLVPLPAEGGFFRQTHRTGTASAILFLLTEDNFSALHRLAQDEIWHFYAGDPVEHLQLEGRSGAAQVTRLGSDVLAGAALQALVPAGVWQGARLAAVPGARHGYALLGCTVSPPWDEAGFELAKRTKLLDDFPAAAKWIKALTR